MKDEKTYKKEGKKRYFAGRYSLGGYYVGACGSRRGLCPCVGYGCALDINSVAHILRMVQRVVRGC